MAVVNRLSAVAVAMAVALTLGTPTQADVIIAGELFVDLDARDPSAGTGEWTNSGTLGDFIESGDPVVDTFGPMANPGVSFDGEYDYFQGPDAPPELTGNSDRTIEVWVYNPEIAEVETMVAWGRRDVPEAEGTNMSFNYGTGEMPSHWGAADHWVDGGSMGWNGAPQADMWHHLVYTYDGAIASVYADGILKNSKDLSNTPLNTLQDWPINIAAQNVGSVDVLGSLAIANVRIHDGALSWADILNNYNEDAARFIGVIIPNNPPVADAGPDQTIDCAPAEGAEVTLNGSGSSDPDGDVLSYSWSEGGNEIASGVSPTVTLAPDTHIITLTVDDGDGGTDTDEVVITINTDTEPPVITVVGDNPQTIECPGPYEELGATASDNCDGDLTESILIDTSAVNASVPGSYVVTYHVSDSAGNEAMVTRTVNVIDTTSPEMELFEPDPSVLWPPNHKFVDVIITGIALDNCGGGLDINVSVEVFDAEGGDGGPKHDPDVELVGAAIDNDGNIEIMVALRAERSGNGDGRIYEITVEVTDGVGNSADATVEVLVPHD